MFESTRADSGWWVFEVPDAGFSVRAWNRTRAKAAMLVAEGAQLLRIALHQTMSSPPHTHRRLPPTGICSYLSASSGTNLDNRSCGRTRRGQSAKI
jgi:hypothetical protein